MMLSLKLPIVILGQGLSGSAVEKYLSHCGYVRGKDFFIYDQKDGSDFQSTDQVLKLQPQTAFLSPGIPGQSKWIQQLEQNGCWITNEWSLAYSLLTTEKVIAVTGSVGKSTTTALLQQGLRWDPHAFVGGNFGIPFLDYITAIQFLNQPKAKWVVLELSSYQLERFPHFSPQISVVTSLLPNHLERYDSLEQYYQVKLDGISQTQDFIIANRNGGDLFSFSKNHSSFFSEILWTDGQDPEWKDAGFKDSRLVGLHNQDNLAMAALVAKKAGWPSDSLLWMKEFSGLPHRMEYLGLHLGIHGINDSKATTVQSVLTCVESLNHDSRFQNKHLLLGGRDKNLPWQQLNALSSLSGWSFYFFGEAAQRIASASGLTGKTYARLKDAVDAAKMSAQPGDLLLLSPGGTSLDEFKNFEDRGDQFRNYFFRTNY